MPWCRAEDRQRIMVAVIDVLELRADAHLTLLDTWDRELRVSRKPVDLIYLKEGVAKWSPRNGGAVEWKLRESHLRSSGRTAISIGLASGAAGPVRSVAPATWQVAPGDIFTVMDATFTISA